MFGGFKQYIFNLTSYFTRQSIGVGLDTVNVTSQLSQGVKGRVQDELVGQTGETDSKMSGAESD